MKHYARDLEALWHRRPDIGKLPKNLSVVNEGNNQRSGLTLDWNARGNAMTELRLPGNAKRGQYRVEINGRTTARFTVADFRLPVYKSEISIPRPMWWAATTRMSMCVCRSCRAVRPAATS